MNKTTQLLRVIQMFNLVVNPVFLVPLQLSKAGFFAPKKRTAVITCFLIATYGVKIYFFTRYKLETVQFYIEIYHLVLMTFLSTLSYIGYVLNSGSIAKILNDILSQSKSIADQVFCRKVCIVAILELLIAFGIPFFANVWCNSNPFFFSSDTFWLFTIDIWLAFILAMHLTSTTLVFSNAILLCRQNIAEMNKELVKKDRTDRRDTFEAQLLINEKDKDGWMSRLDWSEDGITSMITTYDSVCQSCADLSASYGCSISCTYISSLTDIILMGFYTLKHGMSQLWIFFIINSCYFLNIWFILFACESFTKEVQKTGVIVSRLMLGTENQKQKELFQQFSIFLLHRKIKFTAWGLFDLDYKMVYSALSMVITYLVLVHQFDNKYTHRGGKGT